MLPEILAVILLPNGKAGIWVSEAVQLLLPFGTPKELRNEEGAQKDFG